MEGNEDPMLGFLFGNVGEDNELEDEYELDKVRAVMRFTSSWSLSLWFLAVHVFLESRK